MKQLFVTPEIAIALKEKGFNEPCLGHYNSNGVFMFFADVRNCNTNSEFGFYPTVPIHQQVTDWLREKHKIFIKISLYGNTFNQYYSPSVTQNLNPNKTLDFAQSSDYYEALNTAIKEALKLI
jgi:hypothetical protein